MDNDIKKCGVNKKMESGKLVKGEHEYIFKCPMGEECKHCGLLRSTIEDIVPTDDSKPLHFKKIPEGAIPTKEQLSNLKNKLDGKPILSPFVRDQHGHIHELDEETRKIYENPKEVDKIVAEAKRRHISDKTFSSVLEEAKAKSAIIITFDKQFLGQTFFMTDFHISVVGITMNNVLGLLKLVLDALLGRLGGTSTIEEKNDNR